MLIVQNFQHKFIKFHKLRRAYLKDSVEMVLLRFLDAYLRLDVDIQILQPELSYTR